MCELTENCGRWKYFYKQFMICSGVWALHFLIGLSLGSPTVVLPQLLKELNSTSKFTVHETSVLTSTLSFSGVPWVFIIPAVAMYFGRKKVYCGVFICSGISFTMYYFSSNVYHILISELFQGPSMGSYTTISTLILTEYTSPKYRGLFLSIKSATYFWGILTANTIGTFFYWKTIPLLGIICTCYGLITAYFLPESPMWLVQNRRMDQAAKSHRWLKGTDEFSEKELINLLDKYRNVVQRSSVRLQISDSLKQVAKKEFYKPILLAYSLLALFVFSGKLMCTAHALDILKKISNSSSTAYTGMLIIDIVTLVSMYTGCGLSKMFKRRSLLLPTATTSTSFLYILSIYLFLIEFSVISENKYVSISLLVGYSISIGCGLMILSPTISGELIPIDARSVSLCTVALISKLTQGALSRLFPYLFIYCGMHGTFLFFGLTSTVILVMIYFYLPETKDRTLQEIAESINGKMPSGINRDKEMSPVVNNDFVASKIYTFKEDN